MTETRNARHTPLFASDRERRLWMWTLVVVACIYATLGIAPVFAVWLQSQGLMAVAFVACMLLVALTVFAQGLNMRPRGVEIGVRLGIAAVYILVLLRLALPGRSHLIEYGVVAALIFEALTERASCGRHVPWPALLTIITTSAIGAIDEFIQVFLPNRVFDWYDILFNFLAGLMAVVALVVLRWARQLSARANEQGHG